MKNTNTLDKLPIYFRNYHEMNRFCSYNAEQLAEDADKLFAIRYEDSTEADDVILYFQEEGDAETAIYDCYNQLKKYFAGRDYNYCDFWSEQGLVSEIWVSSGKEYARFTRLWTAGMDGPITDDFIRFKTIDQYLRWLNERSTFDDQEYPVLVDNGWEIIMDLTLTSKSYKNAIEGFANAFMEVEQADGWAESIRESCDNGVFSDCDGWKVFGVDDEITRKDGYYSWSVEEVDEWEWRIRLNLAGSYAGRSPRA